MKFRLVALLWSLSLFAAALGAFGEFGIVVASVVLGFWLLVHLTPQAGRWVHFGYATYAVLLVAFFLPPFEQGRGSARRALCQRNLKAIGRAIQAYEKDHGHLPLASDPIPGQPSRSWRETLLPYLKKEPSPAPSAIADAEYFQCPAHEYSGRQITSYFAVVGPKSVWPSDRAITYRDIRDGLQNTILLIEAPRQSIPWSAAQDLTFEQAIKLLTSEEPAELATTHLVKPGAFFSKTNAINVLLADGTVIDVALPMDPIAAEALLTADGGDPLSFIAQEDQFGAPTIDRSSHGLFLIFAAIALMPILSMRRVVGENTVPAELEAKPGDASHRG